MTYNIAYEIEWTIVISCRVGYLEGIILLLCDADTGSQQKYETSTHIKN